MKKYGEDYIVKKVFSRFTWLKCQECSFQFKNEIMWKIKERITPKNKKWGTFYLCNNCICFKSKEYQVTNKILNSIDKIIIKLSSKPNYLLETREILFKELNLIHQTIKKINFKPQNKDMVSAINDISFCMAELKDKIENSEHQNINIQVPEATIDVSNLDKTINILKKELDQFSNNISEVMIRMSTNISDSNSSIKEQLYLLVNRFDSMSELISNLAKQSSGNYRESDELKSFDEN